jgi:hypothetical protein
MIAYLPQTNDSIEHALGGISSLLLLAKNNSGHTYWPSMGIDNIGFMQVGQGYLLNMTSTSQLIYPLPDTGLQKQVARKSFIHLPAVRHFASHAITGNNATLLAKKVTFGGKIVPDSSEVSAIDASGTLVGSGTVIQGKTAFAVWGKNSQTKVKDGCIQQEEVSFKLWDRSKEYPLDFIPQNGRQALYGTDSIFLGELKVPDAIAAAAKSLGEESDLTASEDYPATKFDLTRASPNPFRGSVTIAFDVPAITGASDQAVEISVYDLKGSLVKQLAGGKYQPGHYSVTWNCGADRIFSMGSSVYIVRMRADNFDKRLKLVRVQ